VIEHSCTIGVIPVLDALAALHSLGLDTRRLTRGAKIDDKKLVEPNLRLGADAIVRLFAMAEELSGDSNIGLHAGERAPLRDLVSHLVLSCTDLEEGLRHACRFHGSVIDNTRMELEDDGDTLALAVAVPEPAMSDNHHLLEYVLILNARMLATVAGTTSVLQGVHLCHGDRRRANEASRAFGCRASFGQDRHALLLSKAQMRSHARPVNPLIGEQIEKFAQAILCPPPSDLLEHVAGTVRVLLAAGSRADRSAVSRRMHMRDGDLAARLDEAETSFPELRETVVMDAAQALLLNPSLKVEAVALCLGFGDAATFSKRFKRHCGLSPSQYRQQAYRGLLH